MKKIMILLLSMLIIVSSPSNTYPELVHKLSTLKKTLKTIQEDVSSCKTRLGTLHEKIKRKQMELTVTQSINKDRGVLTSVALVILKKTGYIGMSFIMETAIKTAKWYVVLAVATGIAYTLAETYIGDCNRSVQTCFGPGMAYLR